MSKQVKASEPVRREHQPAELLRQHGLRVTPQRRAIWAVFNAEDAGHLSAEEVYRRARVPLPELARGTVYKTLNELVAARLLSVVRTSAVLLYDRNTGPHHHFRCRSCNELYDVHPAGVEQISLATDSFHVEQTNVLFDGVCSKCAQAPAS